MKEAYKPAYQALKKVGETVKDIGKLGLATIFGSTAVGPAYDTGKQAFNEFFYNDKPAVASINPNSQEPSFLENIVKKGEQVISPQALAEEKQWGENNLHTYGIPDFRNSHVKKTGRENYSNIDGSDQETTLKKYMIKNNEGQLMQIVTFSVGNNLYAVSTRKRGEEFKSYMDKTGKGQFIPDEDLVVPIWAFQRSTALK
jgi:hypothetical protein